MRPGTLKFVFTLVTRKARSSQQPPDGVSAASSFFFLSPKEKKNGPRKKPDVRGDFNKFTQGCQFLLVFLSFGIHLLLLGLHGAESQHETTSYFIALLRFPLCVYICTLIYIFSSVGAQSRNCIFFGGEISDELGFSQATIFRSFSD